MNALILSRVMYHVPLNVSDYVVYMLVVEDDSFVPWVLPLPDYIDFLYY